MWSPHPARRATVLVLGFVVSGCHDWTAVRDAAGGDEAADGPPDAADADGDLTDRPGDGDAADADGGGPDVREDAGPDGFTVVCGDGILGPGEECELGEDAVCINRCGTRSIARCQDDCRLPPPEACPVPEEVCNGLDDDCNGVPDDPAGLCPDCVVSAEGTHVYHFCGPLPWVDAAASCRDRGLHLVTIDDELENADVSNIAWTLVTTPWWMGLNDRDQEGVWVWEGTSRPPRYTNWAAGQPDNSGEEDCGEIGLSASRDQWNDAPCDIWRPFVCEYP